MQSVGNYTQIYQSLKWPKKQCIVACTYEYFFSISNLDAFQYSQRRLQNKQRWSLSGAIAAGWRCRVLPPPGRGPRPAARRRSTASRRPAPALAGATAPAGGWPAARRRRAAPAGATGATASAARRRRPAPAWRRGAAALRWSAAGRCPSHQDRSGGNFL